MRILIIDDDKDTRDFLTTYLESEGFTVHTAYTGLEGLQMLGRYDPDLVILDILLLQMSGWEVCRRIRLFSDVPIIMISAVAQEVKDIMYGINIGADDYITKPIDLGILKMRVKALLRRRNDLSWRQSSYVHIDNYLLIDLYRQQVYVEGQLVSLSPLEYQLLGLLVRNANQTVTILEIIEELWAGEVEDKHVGRVYTYIRRLRRIIEPDLSVPCYIVSEYGLGYRFVPQV